ncbi:MAG: YwaF family protein [Clostridia bacterium]|nr:YwaF family protein [Clostridia bacterium]
MLFDFQHIVYMVTSAIITVALLILANKLAIKQSTKNLILLLSAIVTLALHYSNLYVDYFTNNGDAYIENNHILPVYPCNVVMWLLFICSIIKDKNSIGFKVIAEFCFYAGVVCGIIGIVLNTNYSNTPSLADYDILKGLLSHSTMLFGCIYLFTGKYVKISVFNTISVTLGLLLFVICGLVVNGLYSLCGMEPVDGMFLLSNDYIPVSPMVLGIPAIIILFLLLWLYEHFAFKEEDKWQNKLKSFLRKNKNKGNR